MNANGCYLLAPPYFLLDLGKPVLGHIILRLAHFRAASHSVSSLFYISPSSFFYHRHLYVSPNFSILHLTFVYVSKNTSQNITSKRNFPLYVSNRNTSHLHLQECWRRKNACLHLIAINHVTRFL